MININDKKAYLKELAEFINKYPNEVWCKIFELEENFKNYFWVNYASACSSWSSALLLSLKSIWIKKNDEILLNINYFISDPNAIKILWAKPIFIDLWKDINLLSLEDIKNKTTSKTKAIIIIHMYWYPIENIVEIINYCQSKNIIVIEDCCQSIWAKIWDKYIWNFWDIWVFSFDSNKFVKWWEWWIIISNNKEIIEKTRYYKNNCKSLNWFLELWFNFRYNDFSAIYTKYSLKNLENTIKLKTNKIKEEKNIIIPKKSNPTYYSKIKKEKNNKIDLKKDFYNIDLNKFPNYKFYLENYVIE